MTKKNNFDLMDMVTFPDYKKIRLAFRSYIIGKYDNGRTEESRRYLDVLTAMEIAEKYHNGKRKNGEDEVSHQYIICAYLMTIEASLEDPVACYVVALLHDTWEDYAEESEDEIKDRLIKYFKMVQTISKVRNGVVIEKKQYYDEMSWCIVCSIVKLVDRFHNLSTMIEPFSIEKQLSYLKDLDDWFLPLLKSAKRRFPSQTAAYENLKMVLTTIRNVLILSMVKKESIEKKENM